MNKTKLSLRSLGVCVLAAIQVVSILLLLEGAVTEACVGGPSDYAAIEVVLNKPGVAYDLSKLGGLKSVAYVDEDTYAYRAHLNMNITVIVTLQKVSTQPNAPRYLAVRVQSPIKIVNITYTEYSAICRVEEVEIDPGSLQRIAENEGWHIEELGAKEGYFGAVLTKNVSDSSIILMVKAMEAKKGYDLYFSITVKGSMGPEVKDVAESLIRAVTGSEQEVKFEEMNYTHQMVEPVTGADTLKASLAYELKWLADAGVIKGLNEDDISRILEASVPGYSGWNSRLVYGNGDWMPYYDALAYIPGAALVRAGCEDLATVLGDVTVPNTPPEALGTGTGMEEALADNMVPLLVSLAIGAAAALIAWLAIKRVH